MTTYRDLIEWLEDGRFVGDRTNEDIGLVVGAIEWNKHFQCFEQDVPDYTGSIDAALSLVWKMLPDADIQWFTHRDLDLSSVSLTHGAGWSFNVQHQAAPVAFLIALLRALEAQSKDKEEGGA